MFLLMLNNNSSFEAQSVTLTYLSNWVVVSSRTGFLAFLAFLRSFFFWFCLCLANAASSSSSDWSSFGGLTTNSLTIISPFGVYDFNGLAKSRALWFSVSVSVTVSLSDELSQLRTELVWSIRENSLNGSVLSMIF